MKNEEMYPSLPHSTRMHKLSHLRESEIRNPEIFASASEILGIGIRTTAYEIRNPINDWNLESSNHKQTIRNPVAGIRNPRH